jgi:hypothetical protein
MLGFPATRNSHPMRRSSLGALALCLLLAACGGGGDSSGAPSGGGGGGGGGGGTTTLSHNAGTDCISCHRSGGSAAANGIFTVAGTVYRSNGTAQTAATVQLYPTGSNTAQATLTTDALGNFYTTQAVASLVPAPGQQFALGANVVVRPTGGSSRAMPGTITNGSCNGCHSPGGGVARVTAQQADSMPRVSAAAADGNADSSRDSASQSLAQITTGAAHGCVIADGGTVLCWGSNSQGQLGSSVAGQATPIPVQALGHVSAATSDMAIAAGDHHTCVLSAGGLVLCWGANDKGQLGNGTTEPAVVSVVPLSGVTALSASGDRTCARVGDGATASFHCWGLSPEVVDLDSGDIPHAVLALLDGAAPTIGNVDLSGVAGLESASFTHVASHGNHGCGITTDSRLMCWEGSRASVAIPLQ